MKKLAIVILLLVVCISLVFGDGWSYGGYGGYGGGYGGYEGYGGGYGGYGGYDGGLYQGGYGYGYGGGNNYLLWTLLLALLPFLLYNRG